VTTAAIFRSIFTVIENRRPSGGPHRCSSRPGHPHHDRPGGKRDGAAGRIRGQLRLPPILPADYFALSVPSFAARAWLQINLLCVLGEVISEREADLVHGV
jgi:hypothetical protein